MNKRQAKEILMLYRPETADARDASFTEALAMSERDDELKRWFAEHCAAYAALRLKFRAIEVPAGLKEQILSERKVMTTPLRRRILAAAVASLVVLAAIGLGLRQFQRNEARNFSRFRGRMVSTALRLYAMDLETNNLRGIQSWLAAKNAPDGAPPAGLARSAQPVGCAALTWESHPVSMICFRSGKPLAAGQASDVWLFVIDRAAVSHAPGAKPQLSRVNRLTTASWSNNGKIYLLAAEGDEEFLKKFL